jgi:hypothetical protein
MLHPGERARFRQIHLSGKATNQELASLAVVGFQLFRVNQTPKIGYVRVTFDPIVDSTDLPSERLLLAIARRRHTRYYCAWVQL